MESSGKTGYINVSERTKYWLEKTFSGLYRFEPHELVYVKSLNQQIQSYLIYANTGFDEEESILLQQHHPMTPQAINQPEGGFNQFLLNPSPADKFREEEKSHSDRSRVEHSNGHQHQLEVIQQGGTDDNIFEHPESGSIEGENKAKFVDPDNNEDDDDGDDAEVGDEKDIREETKVNAVH